MELLSPQSGLDGHGHSLTRRAFMGAGAGVAAATVATGLRPEAASAHRYQAGIPRSYPKPIPGGIEIPEPLGTGETYHLFLPGPGNDPSTITDFKGAVGLSLVRGQGTATHTESGRTERLTYEVDVRFMDGAYMGDDGKRRTATIAFF